MKKRIIIAIIALLSLSLPASAVFNEKDLKQTLSVLRYDLMLENRHLSAMDTTILTTKAKAQRKMMIEMIKKCNELSLMLYSQHVENTFDLSYALKEVTQSYNEFNKARMPYDEIINGMDLEIERYSRLVESLRRLPPQMEEIEEIPDSVRYKNDTIDKVDALIIEQATDVKPVEETSELGVMVANNPMHKILNFVIKQQEEMDTPFVLEGSSLDDRDSCLYYAVGIMKYYLGIKERFSVDNQHYEEISTRLKESYDYAQERYKNVQRSIFIDGNSNYIAVLKSLPLYFTKSVSDFKKKYSGPGESKDYFFSSEWKGPMIVCYIVSLVLFFLFSCFISRPIYALIERKSRKFRELHTLGKKKYLVSLIGIIIFGTFMSLIICLTNNNFIRSSGNLLVPFVWLLGAILISMIIRLDQKSIDDGLKVYTPILWLGMTILLCRLAFVPNSIINLVLPAVLLIFLIWQIEVNYKYNFYMQGTEKVVNIATLLVMFVSAILALVGYVFLSIQIFVWWLFQMAMVLTIIAVSDILHTTRDHVYLKHLPLDKNGCYDEAKIKKGDYISHTVLFDFIDMVFIPLFYIISFLMSLWHALKLFDMKEFYHTLMNTPFFNLKDADGNVMLDVTGKVLVVVLCMFFVFRFINYAVRALYKAVKYASLMRKSGAAHIRDNQVNLTLANNVISILVWGSYVITVFWMLKIPTGALSIIAAGLATGIGLAMKDILNNTVYGIQLMSGRLRVGDYIDCDGIRGVVTDIGYQSTQVESDEGAVVSFLNADLLSNRFKNLTRNNSYELVAIPVGISYGTDVKKVREVLLESMPTITYKDKYGRDVIDPKKEIEVEFFGFGDNSVDINVKVYVLAAERIRYLSIAKEQIYNTLNANDITIPFPQRDVYLRMMDKESDG